MPAADWHPDELRALAVVVLLDALADQSPEATAFLTSDKPRRREWRRFWLQAAGLDVEAAEAALGRQRAHAKGNGSS